MILKLKGDNLKFHHLGIAVANLKEVGETTVPVHDPIQGVTVAFADLYGCPVEFIAPAKLDSPVSESLKENRKLVHICFEVDNLEKTILEAQISGFVIVHEPVPAKAFGGRRIAWLYSRVFGLVEFLER